MTDRDNSLLEKIERAKLAYSEAVWAHAEAQSIAAKMRRGRESEAAELALDAAIREALDNARQRAYAEGRYDCESEHRR